MWLIIMVCKSPKAFLLFMAYKWGLRSQLLTGMILQVDKGADMHLVAYDGEVLHGF